MQHTESVIEFLKTQTDSVVLFYSGGKDSLVLLDLLHSHGFKVNIAFMYFVEGLEHVEKYLDWAKKKYGVQVMKYPHWMLTQYYKDNYYRFHTNEEFQNIKLGDIENAARKDFGCQWIVSGMKQNDSLNRRLMLKTYFMEALYLDGKRAYPLSTWKKQECLSYIKFKKLPMPISYTASNSSGVDLNKDVLLWIKEHYPDDLRKILEVFPFAETLIL